MKDYWKFAVAYAIMFTVFLPFAYIFKKINKQRFSFKEYFWFTCGYMIFAAIMGRFR